MSIYCTTFDLGLEHSAKCKRVKNGVQNDSRECTCGSCPIFYQGSHVLPADSHKRAGHLDLGTIPGHIDYLDRPAISDDMQPYHPWLRFSLCAKEIGGETIVLDRGQVGQLRDALSRWIEIVDQGAHHE